MAVKATRTGPGQRELASYENIKNRACPTWIGSRKFSQMKSKSGLARLGGGSGLHRRDSKLQCLPTAPPPHFTTMFNKPFAVDIFAGLPNLDKKDP